MVRYEAGCKVAAAFLLVCQCWPLLWGRPFYIDWFNHIWLTEYFAEHLKQGGFPNTIDVAQAVGNPAPSFYGVFLYPLLALPSTLMGADVSVRLFCVALFVAPLAAFALLFRHLTGERGLALLLAVAVNASVYQLTNLFARGALTEFVGTQCLLLAISLIGLGVTRQNKSAHASLALGFACATLGFGSHPLTFYSFVVFVVTFAAFAFLSLRKLIAPGALARCALWSAVAIAVLTPWLLLTVRYRGDLQINTTNIVAGTLSYFPTATDSLWGKLGLFYVDPRVTAKGVEATSTPFMDAPLAIGLALIVGAALYKLARIDRSEFNKIAIPMAVVLTPFLIAMIPPPNRDATIWSDSFAVGMKDGLLYAVLVPLQFVYRLSGTFTLLMAVATIAVLGALQRLRPAAIADLRPWAVAGVLLALSCMGQKLWATHAEFQAYRTDQLPKEKAPIDPGRLLLMDRAGYLAIVRNTKSFPFTFYGRRDYSMPRQFPPSANDTAPKVEASFLPGEHEVRVSCAASCLVQTNAMSSNSSACWLTVRRRQTCALRTTVTCRSRLRPAIMC